MLGPLSEKKEGRGGRLMQQKMMCPKCSTRFEVEVGGETTDVTCPGCGQETAWHAGKKMLHMRGLPRILIVRAVVGFCFMVVCATSDVSDAEILKLCNEKNPSGTERGWDRVARTERSDGGELLFSHVPGPVPCRDHDDRTHFLVSC